MSTGAVYTDGRQPISDLVSRLPPQDGGRPVAFELFRSLTGRRSVAQVRQLDWRVSPDPYLPAFQFGPFTMSAVDIVE